MLRKPQAPPCPALIGHVRRRTGLTNRAIRFYEDRGMVVSTRDRLGRRSYDERAIERLVYIALGRQAGLQVSELQMLLEIGDRDGMAQRTARTEEAYRTRLAELEDQRRAVQRSAENLGLALERDRPRLRAQPEKGNPSSQTSIDCWAKMPAIAPCDDARVTDGGVMGLARSPAA
ncbi:MAG TPA: MerR family transcriptional regulator [Caulobacter sp.]|nr:MerR family transcriptional regulator [Caulobacter sp.]